MTDDQHGDDVVEVAPAAEATEDATETAPGAQDGAGDDPGGKRRDQHSSGWSSRKPSMNQPPPTPLFPSRAPRRPTLRLILK